MTVPRIVADSLLVVLAFASQITKLATILHILVTCAAGDGIAPHSMDGMMLVQTRASMYHAVATSRADTNRILRQPQIVSQEVDPTCKIGILSNDGGVCCDSQCGSCGGHECSSRPGGASNCCADDIRQGGATCDSHMPPCVPIDGPSGKRIAVLMRGEIYRHVVRQEDIKLVNEDCSRTPAVTVLQEEATKSIVENVIQLYESFGSTIDIFVTASTCDRINEVVHLLGKRRVRYVAMFDSDTQRGSMRNSLDGFKQSVGGVDGVVADYDLIVLARHDMYFSEDARLALAHLNTGKFNFLSPCFDDMKEPSGTYYEHCRMDSFYTMPSHAFAAFDLVVGASNSCCFQPEIVDRGFWTLCSASGHFCKGALTNVSMPDDVSFGLIYERANDSEAFIWLYEAE